MAVFSGCLTRLFFYFNWEHFLFEIEFSWRQIFEILIIHKPSLGSCELPQKLGQIDLAILTFIGNKQTDKQSIYIYIDCDMMKVFYFCEKEQLEQ